jgi:integrase
VNKKWQLCWRHNTDRLAPKLLGDYIKGYSSPFPQNVRYFLSLTAKLKLSDSDSVLKTMRTKDLKRYRALGRYLKVYELPEILTWRAIHEALPKRNEPGRLRCQLVRSGLLELGNTFFQAGLLPSWESYLNEQRLDRYLKATPAIFVEHLAAFERWAAQGMLNPKHEINLHESQPLANSTKNILETVYAIVVFLDWCVKRNIDSLTDINQSTVATYKETLFWQQECKACRKRIPFDTTSETCGNEECQATNSYVKIRRLARASVNRYMANLRTFFNWAQLHDVVREHPVAYDTGKVSKGTFTVRNERGEMIEIADSIRRYDDDVVERLCCYMVAPDADPEEALVLYLIIFHHLTVTELRNAKIPSLAAETPPGDRDRAKDFEYLLLPVRERSRGRHVPRRDGPIMKYPKEAAHWLRPLLERYFEKRRRGRDSEYLFVGQFRPSRNTMPVDSRHIYELVYQASLRVLNGTINPRDLRGTVAAIRADMSKRRGAILTKLGYSSERATRFNYLETFLLVPKTPSTK